MVNCSPVFSNQLMAPQTFFSNLLCPQKKKNENEQQQQQYVSYYQHDLKEQEEHSKLRPCDHDDDDDEQKMHEVTSKLPSKKNSENENNSNKLRSRSLQWEQSALKFLDVLIVIDFPTFVLWGRSTTAAQNKAISILSQTKAMFVKFQAVPFGVDVRIAGIVVFGSPDPFNTQESDGPTLLKAFNDWKAARLGSLPQHGVAHFFTARPVKTAVYANDFPVVCNDKISSSLSLSTVLSDAVSAKLVAHALGHAIGLQHTNQYSYQWGIPYDMAVRCFSTPNAIMQDGMSLDSAAFVWTECDPIWFRTFLSGNPNFCEFTKTCKYLQPIYGWSPGYSKCMDGELDPIMNALPTCGDGVLDRGEQCDCGPQFDNATCTEKMCCDKLTCKSIPNCVSIAPTKSPAIKHPTKLPTRKPTPKDTAWCYNLCSIGFDNGRCDDGGPGSVTGLCPYGADCLDCGPRLPITIAPGFSPTQTPVIYPTYSPTSFPTFTPSPFIGTRAPITTTQPTTAKPSLKPTSIAPTSLSPSASPTFTTDTPSAEPTRKATNSPVTAFPSNNPTHFPTKPPTNEPTTVSPSASPTMSPTFSPTSSPSPPTPSHTTHYPSAYPSTLEPTSLAPTTYPTTLMPTTNAPTTYPTTLMPTTTGPTQSPYSPTFDGLACPTVDEKVICKVGKSGCSIGNAKTMCDFCGNRCIPKIAGANTCSKLQASFLDYCATVVFSPAPSLAPTPPTVKVTQTPTVKTNTPTQIPTVPTTLSPTMLTTEPTASPSGKPCPTSKLCNVGPGSCAIHPECVLCSNRCVTQIPGLKNCSPDHLYFLDACNGKTKAPTKPQLTKSPSSFPSVSPGKMPKTKKPTTGGGTKTPTFFMTEAPSTIVPSTAAPTAKPSEEATMSPSAYMCPSLDAMNSCRVGPTFCRSANCKLCSGRCVVLVEPLTPCSSEHLTAASLCWKQRTYAPTS